MKHTNIERDRNKAKRDLNRVRKELVYARWEIDCLSKRLDAAQKDANVFRDLAQTAIFQRNIARSERDEVRRRWITYFRSIGEPCDP